MYATIQISPYIQIQGVVMRRLPSGDVVIRHQEREYVGSPLTQGRKAALALV